MKTLIILNFQKPRKELQYHIDRLISIFSWLRQRSFHIKNWKIDSKNNLFIRIDGTKQAYASLGVMKITLKLAKVIVKTKTAWNSSGEVMINKQILLNKLIHNQRRRILNLL